MSVILRVKEITLNYKDNSKFIYSGGEKKVVFGHPKFDVTILGCLLRYSLSKSLNALSHKTSIKELAAMKVVSPHLACNWDKKLSLNTLHVPTIC